jgi:hypothetical protein
MVDIAASRILLLDLQDGLIDIAGTQSPAELRRGATALLDLGKVLDIPAAASIIPAGPGFVPPVIAEIANSLPSERVQVRTSFGALGSGATAAASEPGPGGVLLIGGIATEGAVFATVMEALGRGWAVRLILEACAGLSSRTEAAAIRQIEAAGGNAASLVSWVAELGLDMTTREGAAVMGSLRGLLS